MTLENLIFLSFIIIPLLINKFLVEYFLKKVSNQNEQEQIETLAKFNNIEGVLGLVMIFSIIFFSNSWNSHIFVFHYLNSFESYLSNTLLEFFDKNNIFYELILQIYNLISYLITLFLPYILLVRISYKLIKEVKKHDMTANTETKQTIKRLIVSVLPAILMIIIIFELMDFFSLTSFVMFFLSSIFLIFSVGPNLIELFHNTEKLPEKYNYLNQHIQNLLKQTNISIKDVKLINTEGSKEANAMVSGILPFHRKIFITDYLLEKFNEEEVVNILAHEIAHVKKLHLIKSMLINIVFSLLAFYYYMDDSLSDMLIGFIIDDSEGFLIILFSYLFIISPAISRKHEYEADLMAAQLTQQPDILCEALLKLGKENKYPIEPSWADFFNSHPALLKRQEHIMKNYNT